MNPFFSENVSEDLSLSSSSSSKSLSASNCTSNSPLHPSSASASSTSPIPQNTSSSSCSLIHTDKAPNTICKFKSSQGETPFKLVKPDFSNVNTTGYIKKYANRLPMPTPSTPSKRSCTKFLVPLVKTPFQIVSSSSSCKLPSALVVAAGTKHVPDSPFHQSLREMGKKKKQSSFPFEEEGEEASIVLEDEDTGHAQEQQQQDEDDEEENLFFTHSLSSSSSCSASGCCTAEKSFSDFAINGSSNSRFPQQSDKKSSPFRGLRDKFELLTSTAKASGKFFNSPERSPLTAATISHSIHHHQPESSSSHHPQLKNLFHHHQHRSEGEESETEQDDDDDDILFSSIHLPVPLTDRLHPWKTGSVNILSAEYFCCFPDFSLPQDDYSAVSGASTNNIFNNNSFSIAGGDSLAVESYFESKYDIIDLLGHGSFANVFKICKRDTQEVFALKKSRNPYSGSVDRKRKLKEVQTMWILNGHPNVTNIKEAWEQDGFLYLVLELCENGTLSDFLRDCKAFSNEQIWFVAQQIANGLSRLHQLDIIHMDLKPENILLTEDYALKLSDFGLSRRKPSDDLLSSSFNDDDDDREGDKIYMAPEVLQGKVEKSSDIFSFGLILLEIAANIQLPSQGESWQALRRGDLSLVHFESCISPSIITLIKAMLNPQPSERICIEKVLHYIEEHQFKILNT